MLYTLYSKSFGSAIDRHRTMPTTDGQPPATLEDNLVFLLEIEEPEPSYDPLTHKISREWEYDLQAKTATHKCNVVELALTTALRNKLAAVDARTRELIAAGFTYDGHLFSLSEQAQMNIVGLKTPIDKGWISVPHSVSTNDDSVEYALADATVYEEWYATAVGTIKAHYDSGRTLKKTMSACTTVAELAAVEDPR